MEHDYNLSPPDYQQTYSFYQVLTWEVSKYLKPLMQESFNLPEPKFPKAKMYNSDYYPQNNKTESLVKCGCTRPVFRTKNSDFMFCAGCARRPEDCHCLLKAEVAARNSNRQKWRIHDAVMEYKAAQAEKIKKAKEAAKSKMLEEKIKPEVKSSLIQDIATSSMMPDLKSAVLNELATKNYIWTWASDNTGEQLSGKSDPEVPTASTSA